MAKFEIGFTEDGKKDLEFFSARDRKTITAELREQLADEPLKETRNRKKLRNNELAPWELRVGRFRVFYEVDEKFVTILAVGAKEHNKLFIRGKEVRL